MKDYYFCFLGSISAAISFIEQLIPIIQLIILTISLTFTLVGIITHIVSKYKEKKSIDIKDIIEAKNTIDNITNNIKETKEKIEEIKKEK